MPQAASPFLSTDPTAVDPVAPGVLTAGTIDPTQQPGRKTHVVAVDGHYALLPATGTPAETLASYRTYGQHYGLFADQESALRFADQMGQAASAASPFLSTDPGAATVQTLRVGPKYAVTGDFSPLEQEAIAGSAPAQGAVPPTFTRQFPVVDPRQFEPPEPVPPWVGPVQPAPPPPVTPFVGPRPMPAATVLPGAEFPQAVTGPQPGVDDIVRYLREGGAQIGAGATAAAHELAHPAVLPATTATGHTTVPIGAEYPQGSPAPDPAGDARLLNAFSDLMEGAIKVGTPAAVVGAVVNLPATLVTLATTYVAGSAADKAAALAQATPAMRRFLTNAVQIAVLGAGTEGIVAGAKAAGKASAEAARTTIAAGTLIGEPLRTSAQAVGRARPVATAATIGEATARPGVHAPFEAIDRGTPSSVDQHVNPGAAPPETLTDIIRTVLAEEPPALKIGEGPDRMAPRATGAELFVSTDPADATGQQPPQDVAPVTFRTARGSVYTSVGQGTQRAKTASGESFAPSTATLYLTPDGAARAQAHIDTFDEGGTRATPQILSDGRIAIIVKDRATNKVRDDLTRIIDGAPAPALGLHPLEVWAKTAAGVRKWHFGNAIVQLDTQDVRPAAPFLSTDPAAADTTGQPPLQAPAKESSDEQLDVGVPDARPTALEPAAAPVTAGTDIPAPAAAEQPERVAESEGTSARTALIARIVSAARKPVPEIVPTVELKGTNGQWYRPQGFPVGVQAVQPYEQRITGYGFRLPGSGATFSAQHHPTEAHARAAWDATQEKDADDFRQHLQQATDEDLQRQAAYWLKDEAAAPARAPAPADTTVTSPARVTHNAARNSIEVKFPDKPAPEMIAGLKADGFRWAKTHRLWYHKNPRQFGTTVEDQLALVRQMLGATAAPAASGSAPSTEAPKPEPEPSTTPQPAPKTAAAFFDEMAALDDLIDTGQLDGNDRATVKREEAIWARARAAGVDDELAALVRTAVEKSTPVEKPKSPPAAGVTVEADADADAVRTGHRAPLADSPPADGAGARSEGTPDPGRDAGRGADRGGRSEPDAAGRAGAPGVRTDAGGVGVPAERGGRAGPAERPPGDVARAADFVIGADTALAVGGERTRIAANLEAIDTLKRIETEQRAATPDEQATLAKYVGWGGLSGVFKDTHPDHARLQAALTDNEYRSARASTPNAHYTSPTVIRAVYDALTHLGVRGPLRVLEPAAGVGHFFGLMPTALAAHASRVAVELDAISGRITQALYPHAKVHVSGLERAPLPASHFDLVVSNVPFGNYQVADPRFKGRPKTLTSAIHNYFFAKALDLVRPGGIVAFITSHYTLDAQDEGVRRYLAQHATLLGAIRLPNTAFKQTAGTEVVTDLVFLQRKATPDLKAGRWIRSLPHAFADATVHVNEYFAEHPQMVLGRQTTGGTMYAKHEYTVDPTGDLAAQLPDAVAQLPTRVYAPPTTTAATPTLADQLPSAPDHVREGAWYEQDRQLFVKEQGRAVPKMLAPAAAARVRGMLTIRDRLRTTMQAMLSPTTTDAEIATAQKALTRAYDQFVKQHGYLKHRTNIALIHTDPDVYTLLALEEWAPKATKPEKAAIFTKRTLRPHTPVTSVGTPKEALLVSLNESGRVDWPRMAALTGETEAALQDALQGRVFFDPLSQTWEEADRYLSGNVKAKLKAAQAAATTHPQYTHNVQALEQVQPADLEPSDIAIRLGAPWVPPAVIGAFARHLGLSGLSFRYSPALAKWSVHDERFTGRFSVQNTEQWGTQRRPAHELLLATLNLGDPTVMDTVQDADGKERKVVNQPETIAAREKQQAMQDEFKTWVWDDAPRATRLARLYNDTMNTMVLWEPKGDHLTLPGTNPAIQFRPHQKNFVWRGLQQPNALAHHVVGAGKTFAGIALALEKRRLGLARKPMVVVPNHLPQQWARDVLRLYPAARVLASEKADFKPENRKRFLSRIATGDWDLIVLPYSHFGRIPVSDDTFNNYLQHELDALEVEIKRARDEMGQRDPSVKELEKSKTNLQAKLRTQKDQQVKDDTLTFEELGVDMLIVDEAHNFKRLKLITKMTRVAGVPAGKGSDRAFDLFVKTRHLAQANPTGGTVFLTGTPISNTMAEMFVLMRYLAQSALDERGIPQFDGWAATFGEKVTAFEISPTGRGFRQKTRFARFTNMPELIQLYRAIADVQTADMLKLPTPPLKGGKAQLHIVPATTELDTFVETLLERYEAVLGRKGQKPDPREDNALKITTDGRQAALDLRLVHAHQPAGGKVDVAGQQIHDLWRREATRRGTQLVFADLGAPNDEEDGKFTVYDALRRTLVALGIPRDEIAFIHDATTDVQQQALFDNVRAGHVRILIGSTEKMGAGTNVQDRLVALHHLDAPWRPSDIEQREGRILRQGNRFGDKELASPDYDPDFAVEIHTYLSERSFDAYLWQLLESKARFIQQALKGDLTSREVDDADDIVLSFGAAKAVATGNPAIMEHAKAQSDLARLEVSESNFQKRKWRLQKQVAALPEQIDAWDTREAHAQALVDAITLPAERKDLTVTTTAGTVSGTDATAAIMQALARTRGAARTKVDAYHTTSAPARVGRVAGVDVGVFITTSFVGENPVATSHWTIAHGPATLTRSATITDQGALASLIYFLENGPATALEKAKTELTTLRSSLAAAQAEVGKAFPHADTVKALRATIKTLEASLNLDVKSQEAEAAAAGTIVTTAAEDKADAAAEQAQADADERGTPAAASAEPPRAEKPEKGTTLQATILPGAAEFGEHVLEPAVKRLTELVARDAPLIRELLAPARVSPASVEAAGVFRAHLAAKAQRIQRAQRTLRTLKRHMDGWSRDQALAFWDVMEGLQPATALPAADRPTAALYRSLLDRKRDQDLLPRGLLKNYLEHYWGHEWQRSPTTVQAAVRRLFGRRPLQGPESYRKRRSIPTMRQGIEDFGLEPLSWNPTEQLLRKLVEMEKSIAAYDIKRELKARHLIAFVAAGTRPADGWVKLPESFGAVYGPKTFTTQAGEAVRIPFGRLVAGALYAPREVARLLENHLSPGLRGKSALFDLYRSSGNFLNMIQLGASAFHLVVTGLESIVSKQALVAELVLSGHLAPAARKQLEVGPQAVLLDLVRGHQGLKAFYASDANAAVLDGIIGELVQAGGGFGWSLGEHTGAVEAFWATWRATAGAVQAGDLGRASASLGTMAIRAVPAAIEAPTKVIMDGWVPRLKMAAFLDLAAADLRTLGPHPDLGEVRRVLGAAWDSIDNRFGQLRYDNLFWHNTLKDLGMASVRAVGWHVGTLREMWGMPLAQARQMGLVGGAEGGGRGKPPPRRVNVGVDADGEPIYQMQPESRVSRKLLWFLSMLVIYGIGGAIYQYLKTGQRPESLKDYFFPRTGERDAQGHEIRTSLPGYFRELFGVGYDVVHHGVATAAAKAAKNWTQPINTLVIDLLTNEDFYRTEIRNPDDPWVAQLREVFEHVGRQLVPLSVRNQERRAGGAISRTESFLGITPAPAHVIRSAAENYLVELQPAEHRTRAAAAQTASRRELRGAVRAHDPAATRAVLATGTLSRRSVQQTIRTAQVATVARLFTPTTLVQAIHAYELATPEERAILQPLLQQKWQRLAAQVPAAERGAVFERFKAARTLPVTRRPVAAGAR